MKSQFLKIAGVKTEAAFYKKYKTEEEFFSAHPEAKKMIKKAQAGTVMSGMSSYLQGMQNLPNMQNVLQGQMQSQGVNAGMFSGPQVDNSISTISELDLANNESGWTDPNAIKPNFAGNKAIKIGEQLSTIAPVVGGLIGGYQSLRAGRRAKKEAQKFAKVTGLQAQASETQDIDSYRQLSENANRRRNAFMPVTTGEEFFPTQGVGTNVLARNGVRLEGGGEIQNTYAPGTLYDDLEYEPLYDENQIKNFAYGGGIPRAQNGFSNWMNTMGGGGSGFSGVGKASAGGTPWNMFGQAGSMTAASLTGNDGGGQIGGAIGGAAGSIFGPAGQAIGSTLGTAIGGLLDTNDRDQRKAENRTRNNMNRMMTAQYRNNIQGQFGGNMEYGGQVTMMEEGGDLATHWGGYAEPMSYNPYLPDGGETVMFRGQSHDESDGMGNTGIGVSYGNADEANVEVERGEPAVKLKDGGTGEENLTVYGNLMIPKYGIDILGDKNAKGKKFKNYIADLSKTEAKQNSLIDSSTTKLNELKPIDSFDKLKLASLEANIKGGNMKLKEIADKKIKAADLQNAINETAEEFGLVADDLARGKTTIDKKAMKLTKAMFGKSISKYQEGGELPKLKEEDYSYLTNLYETANKTRSKADVLKFQKEFHKLAPEYAKSVIGKSPLTSYAKTKGYGIDDLRGNEEGLFGERTTAYKSALDSGMKKRDRSDDMVTPAVNKGEKTSGNKTKENKFETIKYKQNPYITAFNEVLPFLRPSNQEELNARQLMGESFALASNQLEPVQAQPYSPQLRVPYDISMQDQLNEITADQRSAQRMSGANPAAQAMIASQAYGAKSGILANQFRANQAMRDQVYSGNINTLNDAELKNLDIYDRQYTRQAGARSNTKATAQAALNSISDKYAKNALENRTLGTYENLYNYRFDKAGRAINMNPLYQANIPQMYNPGQDPNYMLVQNPDGTFSYKLRTQSTEPSLKTPSYVAEETDFTPIEEDNTEIMNQVSPKRTGGKLRKNYSQSSIVKAFK